MRRRTLRRAGAVLAILALLALAAAFAVALYGSWRMKRALASFDATFGSTEITRFLRPEIPEPENAVTWLEAGAGAVVLSEEQQELLGPRERPDALWTEDEWALARGLVEDNTPALELLRRAAGCPESSYSLDYRAGPRTELPPLAELLRAGGLLWVDALLARRGGDRERYRSDLETLDRLAGSLAAESTVITTIVAYAADRYYVDLVHREVTGGGSDVALLAEMEAALTGRDRQATFLRSLAFEGSAVPRVETEWLLDNPTPGPLRRLQDRLLRPFARMFMATLIEEYTAVGEAASLTWPEVVAKSEARAALGFPRKLAVSLYPNLIDTISKLKAGESTRRLALAALRLRRAQIADEGLPALPTPWVDPYSGKEVVIERRPDGAVLLASPEAPEQWRDTYPPRSRLGLPRFTWELPATP